jgi:tetratricopeptide (TPR) repeat protein
VALTVLGGALMAVGGYELWLKYTAPQPPVVDLSDLDQEIVETVTNARQAVLNAPRSPAVWGQLGAVLWVHEFNAEGKTCFAQAERLDPKDPHWPYMIGIELLDQDQDAAVACFRRSVAVCGEETLPRLRLGELLLERGETDEAEALFRAAAEKTPDDPRVQFDLGQVCLARDDVNGALDYLRKAAAGAAGVKPVHAALAQALHRHGDEKGAEEERRMLAKIPAGDTWFDPWIGKAKEYWVGMRARMARISAYEKQGARAEAVVASRQLVQRYPDSALARLILGEMLNREGSVGAAEPVLREAIKMDPNRGKSYFELGYSLQNQNKGEEAADCYRKGLALDSEDAMGHYNLAIDLASLDDEAGAEEHFRAAIHYRPDFTEAFMGLAMLLGKQGHEKEAVEQAEEAVRVAPQDKRPAALLKELHEKFPPKKSDSGGK